MTCGRHARPRAVASPNLWPLAAARGRSGVRGGRTARSTRATSANVTASIPAVSARPPAATSAPATTGPVTCATCSSSVTVAIRRVSSLSRAKRRGNTPAAGRRSAAAVPLRNDTTASAQTGTAHSAPMAKAPITTTITRSQPTISARTPQWSAVSPPTKMRRHSGTEPTVRTKLATPGPWLAATHTSAKKVTASPSADSAALTAQSWKPRRAAGITGRWACG